MRILLIEDDERLSAAIMKSLKAESFAVDHAGDGAAGEEMAQINDYDVIILDVMMPRQDGWTTLAHLRSQKVNTPILMLTALGDVTDRVKGLDAGADDYLGKPFHFRELLSRVRSLVRRHAQVKTTVIEHFGLTLDLNSHRAHRGGREIALTSKEFALLELFMLNPNTVLTRVAISEHLWDMNFDPKSNVIDSFVRYLRQKVDNGSEPRLLHTVRGSGYILTDDPAL